LSRRQHGAARRAGDYARIAPCRLACSPCAWNQAERAAFCRRRCPLRPGCSLPPGLEERNLLSCPAFGGRRRAAPQRRISMVPAISIKQLRKTYNNGFEALKGISLDVQEGD